MKKIIFNNNYYSKKDNMDISYLITSYKIFMRLEKTSYKIFCLIKIFMRLEKTNKFSKEHKQEQLYQDYLNKNSDHFYYHYY